jgi:hypothetical protein
MLTTEDIKKELAQQVEQYADGRFDSFFKYCSDTARVIDSIFNDQKIRFTQPRALNDPLESNPMMQFDDPKTRYKVYYFNGTYMPSIETFFRVQVIESQINAYGILSLTKIPNSFTMWSQYANGHRGFVLELKNDFGHNASMKPKAGDEYPVKKMEYVDDYAINLDHLVNEQKEIPKEVIYNELFFKKTSRWAYEYEYRMVRPLLDHPDYSPPKTNIPYIDTNIYLFPFAWDCVSSVILGGNMSTENRRLIAEHCEKRNIPLFQACIIRDHKDWFGKPSTVYLASFDRFSSKEAILQARPQSFCTDTISLGNHGTIKISKITDLPYYKDYEEIVEPLYNGLKSDKK